MEDVDHVPESPSLVKQHSVPVGGGKVVAGSEGIRLLMEKNSKLEARIAALEKVNSHTHTHTHTQCSSYLYLFLSPSPIQ